MLNVGLLPALALLAGALPGVFLDLAPQPPLALMAALCAAAMALAMLRALGPPAVAAARWLDAAMLIACCTGIAAAAAALAADARLQALAPPLRTLLDARIGQFAIGTPGPGGDHEPLLVRVVLAEDAAPADGFVSLRARVVTVALDDREEPAGGGVTFSVGGAAAAESVAEWRAGRTLRLRATFRRPARYLNDGVPDGERDLALAGTTLFGSVKSALLVQVEARGSPVEELAAAVRAYVRRVVAVRIAPYDPVAAAIVTAVLIGDRSGLPVHIRERLQAAGTYHVIAISGGNIAILAALLLVLLMPIGLRGRRAALVAVPVLSAYALVVTAGPSVWRATLVAVVYFSARALDHRTGPWQATAVAAAIMVAANPLDVRDPGFILTFGATAALLEGARRAAATLPIASVWSWLLAPAAGSLVVELALLPVSAAAFSRVTAAGVVLNLAAVPLMTIVQVAGLAVVSASAIEPLVARAVGPLAHAAIEQLARGAAFAAYAAAAGIVESARLVDAAPWLARQVPPPGAPLLAAYYAALAWLLIARRPAARLGASVATIAGLAAIAGIHPLSLRPPREPRLALTMFDVGQAEALLLEWPDGQAWLIDAGGAPFGSGAFDIGARVIAPALWARGLRSLDVLLLTHGDPDHVGGVRTLIDAFRPREVWEGVRVPSHVPTREIRRQAAGSGAAVRARRAGETLRRGGAVVRILHPPEPDWERPRVRNDDSVVLEVVYRDVALLLTGDISAEVERTLVPLLTRSPLRILKVAHHGSRSSTGADLLAGWQPQAALISDGRGNTFGHPAPAVMARLAEAGVAVWRTDADGQITLETDGRDVAVTTFVSRRPSPAATRLPSPRVSRR